MHYYRRAGSYFFLLTNFPATAFDPHFGAKLSFACHPFTAAKKRKKKLFIAKAIRKGGGGGGTNCGDHGKKLKKRGENMDSPNN